MKFSITVEFGYSLELYARETGAKVIEGSESQQLATSVWALAYSVRANQ